MFFLGALLQATCVSNGPQTIFDVILLQWLPVRFCGAGAIYGTGSAGRGTPLFASGTDGSKTAHGNWMELVGWVPKLVGAAETLRCLAAVWQSS